MISNNSETINLIDLIKKGELSKALRLCQRLLQKDEANEVLQNSLGIIYRKQEKYIQAEHWARSALKKNNRFWAAHNNLARMDQHGEISLNQMAAPGAPDGSPNERHWQHERTVLIDLHQTKGL